jgi:hypothetical protein
MPEQNLLPAGEVSVLSGAAVLKVRDDGRQAGDAKHGIIALNPGF